MAWPSDDRPLGHSRSRQGTRYPAEVALAFKETYRMLNQRISVFISLPFASLDKLALQTKLHEIGRIGDRPAESAA
jgi:hypothetical protein